MYDFKPSLDDIVKVVKIGKTTLRKRMLEFEDTPSSNLTVDEFHSIDLEEEHDPPSFTRSKKFNKIKQIEEMTNIQEIEREIIQLQESIEAALNDLQAKPRGLLGSYAKLARFEDQILGPNKQLTNIDAEIKETQEFLSEDQINIIRSIVGTTSKDLPVTVIPEISENLRPTLRSLGLVRETTTTKTDNLDIITEVDLEDDLTDESDELDSLSSDLSGNEDEDEEGLDTTLDEDNEDHDNDIDLEMIRKRSKRFKRKRKLKRQKKLNERILARKSMQEVALPPLPQVVDHNCPLMEKIEEIMPEKIEKVIGEEKSETTEEGIAAEKTDELDLTGIDDQEIDAMLLSKDEIKTKAKLWLRANKDWLKEQKEREDIKKKEREESNKFELKPKKARIRKPKNTTPVANPQEAIDRMLQEKRLSSKINYDVLKNLNKDLKKT
jgi:transcription factor IIIB subunit 2